LAAGVLRATMPPSSNSERIRRFMTFSLGC
jgi:hypothetical protein